MKNVILKTVFISCLFTGSIVSVQAFSPPHSPKKAIEACSGKAEGDACSVKRPRGEVEGMCKKREKVPDQLVCVPTHLKHAIEACDNKAVGEACTFTGKNNNTVNGTCHKMLNDNKLVCGRKPKFK